MLFQGLKNIFHEFDSKPIATLGYKIMMMSSKCLDFNSFESVLEVSLEGTVFQRD